MSRKKESGPREIYLPWGGWFPHPELDPDLYHRRQIRDNLVDRILDFPNSIPLSVARRFGSRTVLEELED